MARCQGEELPEDALYLDDDITLETTMALNRSLNIIDRTIGFTDNTHVSKKGYPIDWRGLAMMMKFDQHDISQWEMISNGRASAVIGLWRKTDISPTIKKLLDYLRQLEVLSLLKNPNFIEAIVDDVGTHKRRVHQRRQDEVLAAQREMEAEERRRKRIAASQPVPLQQAQPGWFSKEAKDQLVIGDVKEKTYFDAFICYAREDIKFVKRMLKALEKGDGNNSEYDLKFCVDDRDFFVGHYKYTLTARVMEERCKRIILIMSPDFVRTPMCEFQTEYALSLSPGSANKKLLPLMYRTCDIPPGLKHIAGLYYTRDELKEWFWPRLGGSLQADLQWSEEDDHRSPDWGSISLSGEHICPASRQEIMSSPSPRRKKKSPSSGQGSSMGSGSLSSGLGSSMRSGSLSSISSAGSIVKVDIISDMKHSPSGSNKCGATASPVAQKRSNKPSDGKEPIQEQGSHEVQIHHDRSATENIRSSPPKSSIEVTEVTDNTMIDEEATEAEPDPPSVPSVSSDESDEEEEASSPASLAAAKLNDTYIKEQPTDPEPCEMVSLTDTRSEDETTSSTVQRQQPEPTKPEKKSRLSNLRNFVKRKPKDKEPGC